MKSKKSMISLVLVVVLIVGISVWAGYFHAQNELRADYEADGLVLVDQMPEELQLKYGELIARADQLITELYGKDEMTSGSKSFVLDRYCKTIQLGLCIDVEDEEFCAELRQFVKDAAKYYIA